MHNSRRKRNIIMVSLLAVLAIMTIGYAAFSTQLEISGTSNIDSRWEIKIIAISAGTPVGTAENAVAPSYTDTTANMNVNLYAPGDSMTYEITIQNNGTLDAVLNSITENNSNNPAIKFEIAGIKEGDTLLAGETTKMTVKISYDSNVTGQPENTSADYTLTLNYTQKASGGEITPPVTGMTSEDLKELAVTEGDGLYADEYEAGKYTYKGANPNNYITFNNETWRILSVEADGKVKIVRNGLLRGTAFDTFGGTYGSNQWDRPSDIKTYLNGEYLESITVNKEKIVPSTWSIGEVTFDNNDLAGQIASENGTQSQSANVGLITVSEYLRANTNKEECGNFSLNNDNYSTCKTTNWLFKGTMYWTISPTADDSRAVFFVINYGNVGGTTANDAKAVLPAITLSSDISLSGSGTAGDPYIIVS